MILGTEKKIIIEQKSPIRIILIMDDGKERIENKQISFEMPKALEQYITGTYEMLEEAETIAKEIKKRKLDKNTIGKEMEH